MKLKGNSPVDIALEVTTNELITLIRRETARTDIAGHTQVESLPKPLQEQLSVLLQCRLDYRDGTVEQWAAAFLVTSYQLVEQEQLVSVH